jgi:hypothetical protein
MFEYLAATGDARLNYLAGQAVLLPLSPDETVSNYVLQLPDGSALRQPITPGQTDLSIASTETLGNYRLRAGGRQEKLDRGFSVNVPAEFTRLERASAADIVNSLGKERTRVARNRGEIEVRVGLARRGRELFPIVILAVALVLAAEGLLANRFYRGTESKESKKDFGFRISDFGLPDNNPQSARSSPAVAGSPQSSPVGAGASESRR